MTGKSSIKVHTKKADKAFRDAQHDMENKLKPDIIKRLVLVGERRMKQIVDVDTGNLRGSIGSEVSDDRGTITSSAGYAKYVNDGTKPHIIEPKNKQCLAFAPSGATEVTRGGSRVAGVLQGGQRTSTFSFGGKTIEAGLICVKKVHHPGTKGTKFIDRTVAHLNSVAAAEGNKILSRRF